MIADFDPQFIDYDAYARAVYSPPPALVALAQLDPFWRTFGGSETDRFGFGGEVERQREAAAELNSHHPRQSAGDDAPPAGPTAGGASSGTRP